MKSTMYFMKLAIAFFILLNQLPINGQISVVLNEVQAEAKDAKCYTIELTSHYKNEYFLAGQNYRLYYNSASATLQENSITSTLPMQYTPLKLVQHAFDVDASGYGNLPYAHHLGFISLANDFNLETGKAVALNNGNTIKTGQFCFTTPMQDMEILWAHPQITQMYATAFVEIALLDKDKNPISGVIRDLQVHDLRSATEIPADVYDMSLFPNPFKDRFNLQFNHALQGNASISVEHLIGGTIKQWNLPAGSTSALIEGSDYPSGALLIKIKEHDGNITVIKAIKVD